MNDCLAIAVPDLIRTVFAVLNHRYMFYVCDTKPLPSNQFFMPFYCASHFSILFQQIIKMYYAENCFRLFLYSSTSNLVKFKQTASIAASSRYPTTGMKSGIKSIGDKTYKSVPTMAAIVPTGTFLYLPVKTSPSIWK